MHNHTILKKFSTFTVALLLLFSLNGCNEQNAEIGKPAPDLAAFDLQGNQANMSQWQGKPLLLNFWSGTCGVCVAELKSLEQMAQSHPGTMQIATINVDGENADTRSLVEKRQIHLPVLKDQLKMTGERYGITGTPTSFIIGSDGNIKAKYEGLIPAQELQRLFSGS